MTRRDLDDDTLSLLDDVLHAYYAVLSDLKALQADNSSWSSQDGFSFERSAYWSEFDNIVNAISKEATTLCMLFSSSEYPSFHESKPLIERTSTAVLALYSHFRKLPLSEGMLVWKECHDVVINIIQRLISLVIAIKSGPHFIKQAMQATGTVWESCDAAKLLPHDALTALIRRIDAAMALVKDAIQELTEHMSSEEGEHIISDTNHDSNLNSEICKSGLAMMKACKATLVKSKDCANIMGSSGYLNSNAAGLANVDAIAAGIDRLSPCVDDLAIELQDDEGMNMASVVNEAEKLKCVADSLLQILRSSGVCSPADLTRIDFLQNVLKHNSEKLVDFRLSVGITDLSSTD